MHWLECKRAPDGSVPLGAGADGWRAASSRGDGEINAGGGI